MSLTVGGRLKQLSGLSGVPVGVMLRAIGSGATMAAILASYSGLDSGTVAEHLLVDREQPETAVSPAPIYRRASIKGAKIAVALKPIRARGHGASAAQISAIAEAVAILRGTGRAAGQLVPVAEAVVQAEGRGASLGAVGLRAEIVPVFDEMELVALALHFSRRRH